MRNCSVAGSRFEISPCLGERREDVVAQPEVEGQPLPGAPVVLDEDAGLPRLQLGIDHQVRPRHLEGVAEQERCGGVAADAAAVVGGRGGEGVEAGAVVALNRRERAANDRDAGLDVVRAADVSERRLALPGLVLEQNRHEPRVAERRVAGHRHVRQAGCAVVDVDALEPERAGDVLPVGLGQRLGVEVEPARLGLEEQRRLDDLQVVRLQAPGVGDRRAAEAGRRAAGVDAVDQAEHAGHDGLHGVVRVTHVERPVVGEAVIEPDVEGVGGLLAVDGGGEVAGQTGRRRRWIEVEKALRHRVDAVGRDHVVRKRHPRRGHRIVDDDAAGAQQFREVAVAHRRGRHGAHPGLAALLVVALVVGEEEGAVADDAAAEAAAPLLLAEPRLGLVAAGEEVVAVELLVAEEAVPRAVEVVGARFGQDVHHRTGRAAGLGGVHVGLHLHLGDGVDRRPHADGADVALVVVHAVDQVVVDDVVLAVDRHGGGLAAIVGAVAARQRVGQPLVRAGHHAHQADDVAAVERQVLHRRLGQQRADSGAVGLHQRRLRGDGDVLGEGADGELRVDADAVAGRDPDVAAERAEALQFDLDGVAADGQQREDVVAGVAGDLRAGVAGGRVGDGHRRPGQRAAAGVGHPADHVGGGHLRLGRAHHGQTAERREHGEPDEVPRPGHHCLPCSASITVARRHDWCGRRARRAAAPRPRRPPAPARWPARRVRRRRRRCCCSDRRPGPTATSR